MDDDAAVEAFERLGLTAYEAKVFVGLQKLGSGSAREVSEVTDVPRSQVYGATDALAEYGLVDVGQARSRLYEQLESAGDRAFDYLETVRGEYEDSSEETEAIWTVSGPRNVSTRSASLVSGADERIVYGTGDPGHLADPVAEALEAAASAGTTVVVTSSEPAVGERAGELVGVGFRSVPETRTPEVSTGRVLVGDRDTMLLSVTPTGAVPMTEETAFWSSGGAFAAVLVTLVEEWVGDLV